MPRTTTAFAAALALFLPIGRPLLVGLTPAVGMFTGLLTTQAAYAQNATDWFDSGIAKAKRGDWQGAIADFTKTIQMYPRYGIAYYNRGVAREELSDFRGAIADYTKVIEMYPRYANACYNVGLGNAI